MTNPAELIADWQDRLGAIAELRTGTDRCVSDDVFAEGVRKRRTFIGYSDREVNDAELGSGIRFTAVYREYLLRMGMRQGDLFVGSELVDVRELEEARVTAIRLLRRSGVGAPLPLKSAVHLFHQGYTFVFVTADGGLDAPVFQWLEGHPEPERISTTFAAMVESELALMERISRDRQR